MLRRNLAAVAVTIAGAGLLAGCPQPGAALIPDGRYTGTISMTMEARQRGQLAGEDVVTDQEDVTFRNGVHMAEDGEPLKVGSSEREQRGAMSVDSEVVYIDAGEFGYTVECDVVADFNGVPMSGTQATSYFQNDDGSLAYFETLELISDKQFDGGAWTIHGASSGTLRR